MSEVFGSSYASTYDTVYGDKDYARECDLVERLFREHGVGEIRSVLDLGCGTGSHAHLLAERGFEVVGVDRSEEMLRQARTKGDRVEFIHGDITDLQLDRTFDAALILFAVLGYQTDNEAALRTLRTAAAHVRPGGVLAFDVWYGPAVLATGPSERFREIATDHGRLLRRSHGTIDARRQLCNVDVHLWQLEGTRLVDETTEQHTMRFFFPLEIELLLENAGFALVRLGAFPDFDREPDETTWNVLAVARR